MSRPETIRRSVTIRPSLDIRVRDLVFTCNRYGVDLDYTRALNLLAELGERWLESSSPSERAQYRDIWEKYLDYQRFEESIMDEWFELEEFRQWKQAKQRADMKEQVSWINVDKPTRICTIHSADCPLVAKSPSRTKGLNELSKGGGWLSFKSIDEARRYFETNWKSFRLVSHSCRT